MTWIGAEIARSVGNTETWLVALCAIGFAGGCLIVGLLLVRHVGLPAPRPSMLESTAVGLGSGLIALTSWWATVGSGGGSAFTPVGLAFAVAVALAARQRRSVVAHGPTAWKLQGSPRRVAAIGVLAGAFTVAIAHLYGSTMVLTARDGVQPVEFVDTAFYSALGAHIAETGVESTWKPSGFDEVPGVPAQNWYHWGEIWIAAGAIELLGIDPLMARHAFALPVLLLAAAGLAGAVVQRVHKTQDPSAFATGFVACLFLAPIPFLAEPFFATWAVGLTFGITQYGLAAVAFLLGLYVLLAQPQLEESWALAIFSGAVFAAILPAHIIIAGLAVAGLAGVLTNRAVRHVVRGEQPFKGWRGRRKTTVATAVLVTASLAYGFLTEHGLAGSAQSSAVQAFNATWIQSIAAVLLGAGVFFAIPAAWYIARRTSSSEKDIYLAVGVILALGTVAWGARLGDFNMFHVFFGGLAVAATPAAAIASWSLWRRAGLARRRTLRIVLAALFLVQIEVGLVSSVLRLQRFGPGNYEPVPLALIAEMRMLPAEAKIAYSCGNAEELAYWLPRLLAISVHSERPFIPMCFQTDSFAPLIGGAQTVDSPSPLFATAPQLTLYSNGTREPTRDAVVAFMKRHGIEFIYSDRAHPNRLISDAEELATIGDFRLFRVP